MEVLTNLLLLIYFWVFVNTLSLILYLEFVQLRPCSFRGYINPTHTHPLSPTPFLLFSLLLTLKQKYHSFPLSPTPSPPFPHSFIQLPSSFNSFQLLPTFTHSFPPFPTLKKKTPLLPTLTHFFPPFPTLTHPTHQISHWKEQDLSLMLFSLLLASFKS